MRTPWLRRSLLASSLLALPALTSPPPPPSFDLTEPAIARYWIPLHDLSQPQGTPEGLEFTITGQDPYLAGPPADYPGDIPLWLHLRLWSDQDGTGQVFYYQDTPSEKASVRFDVTGQTWQDISAPLPPLQPGTRLRLDPPGTTGRFILQQISFSTRSTPPTPNWPRPASPNPNELSLSLSSGSLNLHHHPTQLGSFTLQINHTPFASGYPQALIGYELNDIPRWFSLTNGTCSSTPTPPNQLQLTWTAIDPDGARWTWKQSWSTAPDSTLQFSSALSVDSDRNLLFFPSLILLPGLDSFSTNKHQALLPGLEYLANEPSSSEADVRGPAAQRLVPNTLKLTAPFIALEYDGHYLGLTWSPQNHLAPVFDSPDRQFHSQAHLLGLISPGSDGYNRDEASLLPYQSLLIPAHQPLTLKASIFAGQGQAITAAVKHYVRLRGLPQLPPLPSTPTDYLELAAHGWLHSDIRQQNLYRHAAWPGFNPAPAADAALYMDWLATHLPDSHLSPELTRAARDALSALPPHQLNAAAVGHITSPAPELLYGDPDHAIQLATTRAQNLLRQLSAPGTQLYSPRPGHPDYASTHWEREANGLAGATIAQLLENAALSGNPQLQKTALNHLYALLQKFDNTVPRGAQTWEIPLHTPDILASAHLTKACILGYQLTSAPSLLAAAEYWAWTGVPFVYLYPPAPKPVGTYNTIAVLGATSWTAPVWFGQPVQWCGLVYAESLRQLARFQPDRPWLQVANGIILAGIQHTWNTSDPHRQGLLPDFFLLKAQRRDGPAINPATVQSQAIQTLGYPPVYEFTQTHGGLQIHAPGKLQVIEETPTSLQLKFNGWHQPGSWIILHNCPPYSNIDTTPALQPHQIRYTDKGTPTLMLQLPPQAEVTLQFSESPQTHTP
ncbi:MAG: hypothetical protein RI897_3671 [Verrucomicrobiota bacterium]